MEKNDISRPISTILDGSNYITWTYQMTSFFIGRKLWHIVTGDITKPIKHTSTKKNISKDTTEDEKDDDTDSSDVTIQETSAKDEKYIEKLKDWDSKNHQSLGWVTPLFQLFILNSMHLILQKILEIFCPHIFSVLGLLIIIKCILDLLVSTRREENL